MAAQVSTRKEARTDRTSTRLTSTESHIAADNSFLDLLGNTMLLLCLVTCLFLLLTRVGGVGFGGSDGGYLYDVPGGDDHRPVIEYQKPIQSAEEPSASFQHRWENPPFLSVTDTSSRVVVFYSPWCPHCQHYVTPYVQLARELKSNVDWSHLSFYAVSCSVHSQICRNHMVDGYPSVQYFMPTNSTGHKIPQDRIRTAHAITDYITLIQGTSTTTTTTTTTKDTTYTTAAADVPALDTAIMRHRKEPSILQHDTIQLNRMNNRMQNMLPQQQKLRRDLLQPYMVRSSAWIEDTSNIFSDADASFRFALHSSILSVYNRPMKPELIQTFRSWLELLRKTLPQQTMMSTIRFIDILFDRWDDILSGNGEFYSTITKNITEYEHWTSFCVHDQKHKTFRGDGYTCGLWQLFHIMTIGFVEWNMNANISDRISTIEAATTLRNYVEHFFQCDECRRNFLEMYDSCQFDRCNILTGETSVNKDWELFSVWLFDVHHDVRFRTIHEMLQRNGLEKMTAEEVQLLRWPSTEMCPLCWRGDGSANKHEIYRFMHSILWPSRTHHDSMHQFNTIELQLLFQILAAVIGLFGLIRFYRWRLSLSHLKSV